MSRIGIMGGTFNPIHNGHLMLAECARQECNLDEVWFIPTGFSYMKDVKAAGRDAQGIPTGADRLEMTELAIESNPYFSCLDIEVRREGATYTCETLEELCSEYPQNRYFFICGADCLYTIETWKNPDRIFQSCTLIAAVRGDADQDEMRDKISELSSRYGAEIILLPFRNLQISSTEIRERVGKRLSVRYMLPDAVIQFIEAKEFYQK